MPIKQLIAQYGLQRLKKTYIFILEHRYNDKIYSDCFIYRHKALDSAQQQWKKLPDDQKHLHQITVWNAKITGNQQHINGEDMFEVAYKAQLLKLCQEA